MSYAYEEELPYTAPLPFVPFFRPESLPFPSIPGLVGLIGILIAVLVWCLGVCIATCRICCTKSKPAHYAVINNVWEPPRRL